MDPSGLRPLTECEKKSLSPYIPKEDLDKADLRIGETPWWLPRDFIGITRGNRIDFRPRVYSADGSAESLALLGHELTHVGQYRDGMNRLKYLVSCLSGYGNSKYEIAANKLQQQILHDLSK